MKTKIAISRTQTARGLDASNTEDSVLVSRLRVAVTETQAELAETERQLEEVAVQLRQARATIEAYAQEVPALRALAASVDRLDQMINDTFDVNHDRDPNDFGGPSGTGVPSSEYTRAIGQRNRSLRLYRESKNPQRAARVRELARGTSYAVSAEFLAKRLSPQHSAVALLHHEYERLQEEPVFEDESENENCS